MALSVPSATDNIYKFYALFGLTLIVSSVLGFVHVVESGNARLYQYAKDADTLMKLGDKVFDESATGAVITKLVSQHGSDQMILKVGLGVVLAVGVWFSHRGFGKWRKEVQPRDNRLKELQIEVLEKELAGNIKD